MPEYVDGFVIPVPKKNLRAYRRMAQLGAKAWMKHGALAYCEGTGDDLQTHCGTPFPRQLKLRRGETVVFAWIVFKSRGHRERVNAKVMKDPLMAAMTDLGPMPFNPKRMLYGGFKVIVRA